MVLERHFIGDFGILSQVTKLNWKGSIHAELFGYPLNRLVTPILNERIIADALSQAGNPS